MVRASLVASTDPAHTEIAAESVEASSVPAERNHGCPQALTVVAVRYSVERMGLD